MDQEYLFNLDATNFDDEYDKTYYHASHNETNQIIFLEPKAEGNSFEFPIYNNNNINSKPSKNAAAHQENMSVLSHSSGYSTNCSAKHSTEYQYEFQTAISQNHIDENEEDNEDSDINTDDKSQRAQNIPERKRKAVYKKNYEPIIDNAIIYKYEDNPEEYKKARKRLQNRESATRVRSKKKTHFENLEQEIHELKEKNAELMIQNASLAAENNLLKNQISFFEKFLVSPQVPANSDPAQNPILPVKNPKIPEPNVAIPWGRVQNSDMPVKRHLTILSAVSFLLYIVNFNTTSTETGQDPISFANQFRNKFDPGLKHLNESELGQGNREINEESEMINKMMEYLMNQHYKFSAIKDLIWKLLFLAYCIYLLYLAYNFFLKSWMRKAIKLKKI